MCLLEGLVSANLGKGQSKMRTKDKGNKVKKGNRAMAPEPSLEVLVVPPPRSPPDGPAIRDMKGKYGDESCKYVGDWVKKRGFPSQVSLSLYLLKKRML